jgi:hypothetical protein
MISIKYSDTIISKNKLKKLVLLHFFLKQLQTTSKISYKSTQSKHKNVMLNSPFHFKTVKSHLYIPSYSFTLINIPFSLKSTFGKKLNLIGVVETICISQIVLVKL